MLKFLGMWDDGPTADPKPVDPVVPADPTPKPEPGTGVWETAKFHTAPESVRAWAKVGTLRVWFASPGIWFEITGGIWPDRNGTIGHLWAFTRRDGVWHGGPCDALRRVSSPKEKSAICVPDGDNRLFVPAKGETWKFVVSGFCRNGAILSPKQRTEEATVIWP